MPHWREGLDPGGSGGRYLSWKEVAKTTGLSRTTAWRLQKRDEFPAPYAISPGRVAYREDEVDAWRASRGPSRAGRGAASGVPDSGPASITPQATARPTRSPTLGVPAAAPTAPPAMGSARVVRRRSQHAKAIAHQMRFDF